MIYKELGFTEAKGMGKFKIDLMCVMDYGFYCNSSILNVFML